MKAKCFALCAVILLLAGSLSRVGIQKAHMAILADDAGAEKSKLIQPLWETVKVSGDCDTNVIFTDVETGKQYTIGYFTHGVSETIRLEKGK